MTLYMVPCSRCGVEYGPMSAEKMKRNTPFVCAVCRERSERLMPRLSDEQIRAILARAEAATPGPWEERTDALGEGIFTDWAAPGFAITRHYGNSPSRDHVQMPVDAAFIAAARTDVPDLAANLLEARAEAAELQSRVNGMEFQLQQRTEERDKVRAAFNHACPG